MDYLFFYSSYCGSIQDHQESVHVEELEQVNMWGPYPAGRSGYTHFFSLVDAYSQYAVSLPCMNKSRKKRS